MALSAISWFAPVDGYCERLEPGFWAEPINALTNAAFLIAALGAALLLARRKNADRAAGLLVGLTVAIGIGSFLFHTFAVVWASLADVIPIAVFILVYFYMSMRRFLGLPVAGAALLTAAYEAASMAFPRLWRAIVPADADPVGSSVGYLPAFLAMIAIGSLALARDPASSRRLLAAGAVFAVSLALRSIDLQICAAVPLGSHFLWHILNGLVLFLLMRAAILAGPAPPHTARSTETGT
ncbi:ceramidase domain-containing protein [Chelatococcus sp. GCM10030263]|uniref:ceramidase domain-containing protein n=1 Tax=Chelatococcus sp. GCM10030263 TaxID=3273387 RepID=UPI00360632ED